MNNGVFEKVNAVLQQEKALGKLVGVPDIDAYRQITEQLYKDGVLSDKNSGGNKGTSNVSSKTDEKANADRNKQRKAVAPVKQTTTKKAPAEEDFLGLSDEAFMKKYAVR